MSSVAPASSSSYSLSARIKDYMLLTKFTLSITVVFSSVICYLLVPESLVGAQIPESLQGKIINVLLLTLGGFLVTGSANAMNQAAEKLTDAMMKRTANRPVASGRMSVAHAKAFAITSLVIGLLIMWQCFNISAAVVSLLSWFIYSFIYTPLKKVSAISVFIGGFPGAFPCLIGWVAGAGSFTSGGWILFAIQFLWQFPHFWAIAWVAHADYDKAGFKLLPNQNQPTKNTALQAIGYAVIMIPLCLLPIVFGGPICNGTELGMSGFGGIIIGLAANLFLVWQCIRLYRDMDVKAARRVMFTSYIWLPVVLLALLAFKTAAC